MSVLIFISGILVLLYFQIGGSLAAAVIILSTVAGIFISEQNVLNIAVLVLFLGISFILLFPNRIRSSHLSKPLLQWVRTRLPKLSTTEEQALNSGDVDWDGELFTGNPSWKKLLDSKSGVLSKEETAFIAGPVEELCGRLNDWEITHELYDLPEDIWHFLRDHGFFGLVIPKTFGGKGFSETAHSEIVMKISTRSISAAVTVMVPNSLGPGELLVHYGTEQQKSFYLPRLSHGKDIPCFALTSAVAGSDAGAIPDKGIVCLGEWKGKETLGLRVTWNKRYITLAPVATLIGLAIKVYDPAKLIGENENIGITCVMIPASLKGVNSGTRHLPMNTAFMNGPTWGKDVFIPMDHVIGGQKMLGNGWVMLLECLAIGRSISLPALATGAGKYACMTTGSYAKVREQFGYSISQFEGVQEALEPIAGYTYMMNAARLLTASMLDRGVRPAVPSALLKYRNTELMRVVVNHAMDVVAGRGVITGPRNFMARVYQAVPIGITVEGANILTRSLMVFGQGAIRCHPFILDEIKAARSQDLFQATVQFDNIFYRHVAHTLGNTLRVFMGGLTGGRLFAVPREGNIQRYYQQLTRFSAVFALLNDITLLSIGGKLKERQRLSGRMADCLVHLYYGSAAIKHWHEQNYPVEQRPLVEWALETSLHDLQTTIRELINNFPVKAVRYVLRIAIFPTGSTRLQRPNDSLGKSVALSIVEDSPLRNQMIQGAYQTELPTDPLGRVLHAYKLANKTQPIREKLHKKMKQVDSDDFDDVALLMGHQRKELVEWAVKEHIVSEQESAPLLDALTALYDVIRVDSFNPEDIKGIAVCAKGKRKTVERVT